MGETNGTKKQVDIYILISNKIDFNLNYSEEIKKGHFILIKGTVSQEDITIPNIGTKFWHINFIKKHAIIPLLVFKTQTNYNSLLVGNCIIPNFSIDIWRKVSRKTSGLHTTNGPNRYLQSISHKHQRMLILLRSPTKFL